MERDMPQSKLSGFSFPQTPDEMASKLRQTVDGAQKQPGLSSFVSRDELLSDEEASQPLSQAQADGQNEPQAQEDPALIYEKRLAEHKISKTEALAIIDALTIEGFYEEELKLSPRIKVTFRTRNTRFNGFLADRVDIADPKKVGKLNQMMSEYNIAGSLMRYGEQPMPVLDESLDDQTWLKVFEHRHTFVKRLPGPVFLAMCNLLARFDAKMIVVFSEGYEQNF